MDVAHRAGAGWIEVVAGSMFSGKSEELIRRLRRAQIARQSVQLFKPRNDARYSNGENVSHSEMKMPSQVVDDLWAAVLAADGTAPPLAVADARSGAERIGIYRRTIRTNYRNALGATYPVVRRVVGAAFFDAAVDAYVETHPSRGGDLNVYGTTFGEFLGGYELSF